MDKLAVKASVVWMGKNAPVIPVGLNVVPAPAMGETAAK
jgi:hypothetical protein